MKTSKHYFYIGFFVLFGFALFAVACVIFGSGKLFSQKIYFETCFDTSVNGLDVGGPVKFRGIPLGEIESINFARAIYADAPGVDMTDRATVRKLTYVRVLCSIDIKKHPDFSEERLENLTQYAGLHTKLQSAGITGGAFIALDITKHENVQQTFLTVPWPTEEYYIPSTHSTLQNVMDTLDHLANQLDGVRLDKLTETLDKLMGTVNESISGANLPGLATQISGLATTIQCFLNEIEVESLGANLKTISENLSNISSEVQEALPGFTASATSTLQAAEKTLTEMSGALREATDTLVEFRTHVDADVVGTDLEESLNAISRTTASLEALVNELRAKPSRIIFDDPLE